MRVTRIPGDFHDIGDRPCRAYVNEVEVLDWTVADDFRRVVETPYGVRFGAVRIDMALDAGELAEEAATHLCGMLVPEPKPEAPVIEIAEAAPEPIRPRSLINLPNGRPDPSHVAMVAGDGTVYPVKASVITTQSRKKKRGR